MNPTDQLMLNRAAFSGDIRTMESVSLAVSGIVRILDDENIELNGFQRDGLHEALKIAAESLLDRADFIGSHVLGREAE